MRVLFVKVMVIILAIYQEYRYQRCGFRVWKLWPITNQMVWREYFMSHTGQMEYRKEGWKVIVYM
jgi:hypothetical protein